MGVSPTRRFFSRPSGVSLSAIGQFTRGRPLSTGPERQDSFFSHGFLALCLLRIFRERSCNRGFRREKPAPPLEARQLFKSRRPDAPGCGNPRWIGMKDLGSWKSPRAAGIPTDKGTASIPAGRPKSTPAEKKQAVQGARPERGKRPPPACGRFPVTPLSVGLRPAAGPPFLFFC